MRHSLWIGGTWQKGTPRPLHSPFSGEQVGEVDECNSEQLEKLLSASQDAFQSYRKLSRYMRSKLLLSISQGIEARREALIEVMVREAGKPATLADGEVTRSIVTFTVASEEAKRYGGEVVPLDIETSGRAYAPAIVASVPRGPVLAIAPFNFPMNLIAHKVAPALAAGCTVMVKPPPQAPGAARILAEIFEKAARESSDSQETIPPAALQVFSCSNDLIGRAVTDPRVTTVSFTGSERVGWLIQEKAIRKKVILELGGNAAVIVHSDADLARAATRCAFGAFAYAGQVCISVQRIFVQSGVAARFQELLISETAKLGVGDPARKDTMVGPLIDSKNADRVMEWIDEARASGARVLAGGKRDKNVITPALLTGVRPDLRVSCEEVFGPVAIVESYDEFSEALASVNHSHYGLQAGVFTNNADFIRQAFDRLEVGAVMVNEVPTYRADNMPYGGVKDSGIGREGVRYAMESYSEKKALVQWLGATR